MFCAAQWPVRSEMCQASEMLVHQRYLQLHLMLECCVQNGMWSKVVVDSGTCTCTGNSRGRRRRTQGRQSHADGENISGIGPSASDDCGAAVGRFDGEFSSVQRESKNDNGFFTSVEMRLSSSLHDRHWHFLRAVHFRMLNERALLSHIQFAYPWIGKSS